MGQSLAARGILWIAGLSLLFLPYALAGAAPSLVLFAVWYGLDWIATVPPTLRLANEAFGRTRAPIVFGWIAGGHQLGAASIALAFRREREGSPASGPPLPAPLHPA